MARQITIALDSAVHPGSPDAALVHRLRNFGEDLYREFSASGKAEVSLDEIDSATSELRIVVGATRHLGAVTAFIEKTLRQHHLDDCFTLSRG